MASKLGGALDSMHALTAISQEIILPVGTFQQQPWKKVFIWTLQQKKQANNKKS